MKFILSSLGSLLFLSLAACATTPAESTTPADESSSPVEGKKRAFSPASCEEAGGVPLPSPGGEVTDASCESGASLGVIQAADSGWIEGGLCCAPVAAEPTGKACGARAGDTCSEKEFCDYRPGSYCGAADAQATCQPRPEMCIEIYKPVCGCDDKTYGNSCQANAAGVGYHSEGECPKK